MSTPEKALQTLIGREPTTEELGKFYRIKEQLGLSDHDVVWTFLLAFGHYEIIYNEIPGRIEETAKRVLTEFRTSADAVAVATERQMRANVEASVSETVRKLSDQVIATGQAFANDSNRRKQMVAIGISIGIAALLVLVVLWAGFRLGVGSRDADVAWLNTPQGAAAKKFGEMNDLQAMLNCTPPLTKVEENGGKYCMPFDPGKKQVRSWRIE